MMGADKTADPPYDHTAIIGRICLYLPDKSQEGDAQASQGSAVPLTKQSDAGRTILPSEEYRSGPFPSEWL